jgi:mono/diheme cytochrome c family protein
MLRFAATFLLLCCPVLLVACSQQDKSNLSDAELRLNAQQAAGRRVYRQYCGVCHEAYVSRQLRSFPLKDLFKKQYMPSGQPANDERVRVVIERGRGIMPGFGDQLSPEEVEALIAYLHTL